MTLLVTLEDSFLQVTCRCRLDRISLDSWVQTFLTIRAHYQQAGTNSKNPGLEAKWILGYTMFLTWKECAASGCRCFISEYKWEQISLTRNRSLLCGAKQIFKTSVLPLHIHCFPHVSSDIFFPDCSWDKTNSLHIGESSTCIILNLGLVLRFFIYRHCGQYCHNLFGFGNWSLTSNMTLQIQVLHI